MIYKQSGGTTYPIEQQNEVDSKCQCQCQILEIVEVPCKQALKKKE